MQQNSQFQKWTIGTFRWKWSFLKHSSSSRLYSGGLIHSMHMMLEQIVITRWKHPWMVLDRSNLLVVVTSIFPTNGLFYIERSKKCTTKTYFQSDTKLIAENWHRAKKKTVFRSGLGRAWIKIHIFDKTKRWIYLWKKKCDVFDVVGDELN